MGLFKRLLGLEEKPSDMTGLINRAQAMAARIEDMERRRIVAMTKAATEGDATAQVTVHSLGAQRSENLIEIK
jgi:hypothetical protein